MGVSPRLAAVEAGKYTLMLCSNVLGCCRKYRDGLTAVQYAARLREGNAP
jgi:hypothetical protein